MLAVYNKQVDCIQEQNVSPHKSKQGCVNMRSVRGYNIKGGRVSKYCYFS